MLSFGASLLVFPLVLATILPGSTGLEEVDPRTGKVFSLFQLVKFKNEGCAASSNKNGTCYTNEECRSRGGIASGSCASGYGVCCMISIGCGGSTSDNCTYAASATSNANSQSSCRYEICKCSNDICRIRLDFIKFAIAGPQVGTTDSASTAIGDAIGACITDQFTLVGANSPPPLICGYNTGQHMIYDVGQDDCAEMAFVLGSGSVTREWEIKITQYKCGHDDIAGPNGCQQYFTGTSGSFASYNFPTNSDTIGATTTHLNRQQYTICLRREQGFCAICYVPSVVAVTDAAETQSSFGVSKSDGAQTDSDCFQDFIQIGYGVNFEDLMMPLEDLMPVGVQRLCGRFFNAKSGEKTHVSVCSSTNPFQLIFQANGNELNIGAAATKNELFGPPGGIVGFSLDYKQVPC